MPEDVLPSAKETERANSFVDLRITGPDALRAGQMLDMSWHPLYLYDHPPKHRELKKKFKELIRTNRLDARLEVLSRRVPHKERVELALQYGAGAGEMQFHGVWAVAAHVPPDRELSVVAERCESEVDRWSRVRVECSPGAVVRSEKIGVVGVDYARLLIADVDVLGGWQHERSWDGKADYVFWGRDAEQVATAVKAPVLEDGNFGWLNVTEDFAQRQGAAVEHYAAKHGLKLAGDYRPHSDHWRVMTPTRQSPTESATVEFSGLKVCNFMTTWGDGAFDVYRDLGEGDCLIAIRIELEELTD